MKHLLKAILRWSSHTTGFWIRNCRSRKSCAYHSATTWTDHLWLTYEVSAISRECSFFVENGWTLVTSWSYTDIIILKKTHIFINTPSFLIRLPRHQAVTDVPKYSKCVKLCDSRCMHIHGDRWWWVVQLIDITRNGHVKPTRKWISFNVTCWLLVGLTAVSVLRLIRLTRAHSPL